MEDNVADGRLLPEALKELKVCTQLSTVADGLDALAFLPGREGQYAQAIRPDLIWLELKLPGKSGLEV